MIRFLNPEALFLSLTISVPLILHFYEKISAKPQILPTISLLEKREKRMRRSSDRLLLLIIRCILLLLLTLLLSNPVYIPGSAKKGGDTIIVLDNSPIMAVQTSGRPLLDIAKRAAFDCYHRNRQRGRVFFLALHPFPGEPSSRGSAAITAIQCSPWRSTLRELATRINRITRGRNSDFRMVFFSAGDFRIWKDRVFLPLEIEYRKISFRKRGNSAITGLSGFPDVLFPGREYQVRVMIDNTDTGYPNNILTVFVDRIPVVRRKISLIRGMNAIPVRIRFRTAGYKRIVVSLGRDEYEPDNRFIKEVHLLRSLPVYFDSSLKNNPFLRASFRAYAGTAFSIVRSPFSAKLVTAVLYRKKQPAFARSALPVLFFSPAAYRGVSPSCLDKNGELIFTLEPSGNTNRIAFTTLFPFSTNPISCSFRGVPRWKVSSGYPLIPLFRSQDNTAYGMLLMDSGIRMALLPFPAQGRTSGLFYESVYPLFFSRLVSMLLSTEGRFLEQPRPYQIRKSVPQGKKSRWYGSLFKYGGSLLPANVSFNPFRYAVHPNPQKIRSVTGSPKAVVGSRDGSGGSHVSLSVLLILSLVLFKSGELYLLGRKRR